MKYLLCILIVAIACCGPAKIKTLKNYDHTKDSLFAQKLNTVLLREFGGEFHSMEFSDKSESWVSKIDAISWPCDILVMENFKYEISLLTNHVKDSVTPASSYLAIGCYISEGDAESALKRYRNLPKAVFQNDKNFCPYSLKGVYLNAAYFHKNYLILFSSKGFDLDNKESIEIYLENYFNNIK